MLNSGINCIPLFVYIFHYSENFTTVKNITVITLMATPLVKILFSMITHEINFYCTPTFNKYPLYAMSYRSSRAIICLYFSLQWKSSLQWKINLFQQISSICHVLQEQPSQEPAMEQFVPMEVTVTAEAPKRPPRITQHLKNAEVMEGTKWVEKKI